MLLSLGQLRTVLPNLVPVSELSQARCHTKHKNETAVLWQKALGQSL